MIIKGAFLKSGTKTRKGFDCLDEFDPQVYKDSLPISFSEREQDLEPTSQGFKEYQSQYISAGIQDTLERNNNKIDEITAIFFDFDDIWNEDEFVGDVMNLVNTGIAFCVWPTTSFFFGDAKHNHGFRLMLPLYESIQPAVLKQAIQETVVKLADIGFNPLDWGWDRMASYGVGRLNGLPLVQYKFLVCDGKKKLRIDNTTVIEKSKRVNSFVPSVDISHAIEGFMEHEGIDFVEGQWDNTLTQVVGMLINHGYEKGDVVEALIPYTDENQGGVADLERRVAGLYSRFE